MKLKFNSYNVLWLETNASHKEINKRYKEIEKYVYVIIVKYLIVRLIEKNKNGTWLKKYVQNF